MWRLPVFCKPITSGGKEEGKGGSGAHGSYGRDWKRAISIEVIKTPFLLKQAEESLAQLHPLNDLIVFNKSQFENPPDRPPSEASAARMGRGLTSSWEIKCLELQIRKEDYVRAQITERNRVRTSFPFRVIERAPEATSHTDFISGSPHPAKLVTGYDYLHLIRKLKI